MRPLHENPAGPAGQRNVNAFDSKATLPFIIRQPSLVVEFSVSIGPHLGKCNIHQCVITIPHIIAIFNATRWNANRGLG